MYRTGYIIVSLQWEIIYNGQKKNDYDIVILF